MKINVSLIRVVIKILVILATSAVYIEACIYNVGGIDYDLTPLANLTLSGGDPDYPARLYNASVCGPLAKPCVDVLTGVPIYGSAYQLTLEPSGERVAFCWDVLADSTLPELLPADVSVNPRERFVLRHTRAGDAHVSCSPNMTVDLRFHCPLDTEASSYTLVGSSDVQCHYNFVIETPLVCSSRPSLLKLKGSGPPPLRRVAVLVGDDFELVDAMGPLEVFRLVQQQVYEHVNITSRKWNATRDSGIVSFAQIEVEVLSATCNGDQRNRLCRSAEGLAVVADACLEERAGAGSYDLVVVPAGVSNGSDRVATWVAAEHAAKASVLTVCTGARVAAELGLLRGRNATTNTLLLHEMQIRYPDTRWLDLHDNTEQRFVESVPPMRVVTTAGVTAGIDGALGFVDEWCGADVAEAIRQYIEWPLRNR